MEQELKIERSSNYETQSDIDYCTMKKKSFSVSNYQIMTDILKMTSNDCNYFHFSPTTDILIQGRIREIHMGEPPFFCTTETAVAVRLSQHHGHWKALEIVFSLIHSRFF